MDTLEGLRSRISTINNLRSIVSSMKTLSAVSIHQFEKASKALVDYARTVEDGMQVVLWNRSIPELGADTSDKKAIAVVFGSDPGLVGRFNKAISQFAMEHLEKNGFNAANTSFIAAGRSLSIKLQGQGAKIDHLFTMASSVKGIAPLAQSIVIKIDELQTKTNAKHVFLFHNRKTERTIAVPQAIKLLPIDKEFLQEIMGREWKTNQTPLHTGSSKAMFSSLVKQLLFIRIHRAIAESLASEHMTRMIGMQAAEKNIDEHLETMNLAYQQRRQEDITEELLDVISGAEALKKEALKKAS